MHRCAHLASISKNWSRVGVQHGAVVELVVGAGADAGAGVDGAVEEVDGVAEAVGAFRFIARYPVRGCGTAALTQR